VYGWSDMMSVVQLVMSSSICGQLISGIVL
jgi:hypothetical protein